MTLSLKIFWHFAHIYVIGVYAEGERKVNVLTCSSFHGKIVAEGKDEKNIRVQQNNMKSLISSWTHYSDRWVSHSGVMFCPHICWAFVPDVTCVSGHLRQIRCWPLPSRFLCLSSIVKVLVIKHSRGAKHASRKWCRQRSTQWWEKKRNDNRRSRAECTCFSQITQEAWNDQEIKYHRMRMSATTDNDTTSSANVWCNRNASTHDNIIVKDTRIINYFNMR